jgi:hypothetical protein
MDESVKCECGSTEFWYFWDRVRCPHCLNEYKQTEWVYHEDEHYDVRITEKWTRKFNNETHEYSNWKKVS